MLELEPRQQKGNYELAVLVVDDNTRYRQQALSAGAVAFADKKDLDTASLRQVIEDALR